MWVRCKDIEIDGEIGEPGEEGKLTYWSLLYQVNAGMDREFKESEIIHAIIPSITPGNSTRV